MYVGYNFVVYRVSVTPAGTWPPKEDGSMHIRDPRDPFRDQRHPFSSLALDALEFARHSGDGE